MSGSVDERVVRMKFDNAQFGEGIASTLASLSKLNQGLKLEGATKGLTDVSAAAKTVSLAGIEEGVGRLADRFKAMSIVGITALTNVVNRAVTAGISIAKSLTIDPIQAGLHEYETNLNAIQTILANTAHEGTNLVQVNAALAELNAYSDKTIYNFGEMARNIGTFTAAGVKLKTSVEAIKGIANLAAISGSNSEQASTAMYQLSQALAAGKVSLMDWNSVVNAGMGGKVFQDALVETARLHGVAIDQMIKHEGGFRNTLEKGWLTSGILTETLSKFTGDLTAAQLKSMGYNDKQIAGIIKMGATAQDAATKVKTMSQLIGTLQESAGSGWATTWQMLFGDFEEAKTLFTGVNNVLGAFISSSADARNKVLGDWKALGGRTVLIQSIANVFHAVLAVLRPVRDAFRALFPPTTGKELFAFTVALEKFTKKLIIGKDTADKLRRTFAGVFSVVSIVIDVLKAAANTLFDFFGKASKGSGGVLDFTARLGDFLVRVRQGIIDGNGIAKVFTKIGQVLAVPIALVKLLADHIKRLFDSFHIDGNKAADTIVGLGQKLDPLSKIGDKTSAGWNKFVAILKEVWAFMQPIGRKLIDVFKGIGSAIAAAFSGLDYKAILGGLNTGLFAGLVLMVAKFVKNFTGHNGSGILHSFQESIEGLTKTLGAMQATLRAAALLQIAIAIGILAVSANLLSKIDPKALAQALGAMAVMFAQLFLAMGIFEKTVGVAGLAKMPLVTGALIFMAIAVDLLTVSVMALAKLRFKELIKGLLGVSVLLAALVLVVQNMPPSERLYATGIGLIIVGAAVKVLASAVKDLGQMHGKEIAKGLVAVGALLESLALFTQFSAVNAGGIAQGVGIILLAVAIKILVSAVKDLGAMHGKEIAKGIVAIAGALAAIGAALYFIPPTAVFSAAAVLIVAASLGLIADAIGKLGVMHGKEIAKGVLALAGALSVIAVALLLLPPSSLLSAAAIFVVAASLTLISDVLMKMSKMSWTEIAKSLIMLAGSLAIIAGAMYLMTGALPGAAALLVVAASLAILAPILMLFGSMSWTEIAKGLTLLAGVFVVIGLAGLVLTPLVGTLLALGVAIVLLGAGMLLAGAGVLLFSIGLTALAVAGAAGALAIVGIVSGLIGLIPVVMTQIGLGLIAFAKVIGTAGPAITEALTAVMLSLLNAVTTVAPKVVDALLKMLLMLVDKMNQYVPTLVQHGLKLLLGILQGISDNITRVTIVVLKIIAAFIDGVTAGLPGIIESGTRLVIAFVNGLANSIRAHSKEMGDAGGNLASAMIEGMIQGLRGGAGRIISEAKRVAQSAYEAAKNFLDINSPSRKFIELGKSSNEGMAIGLSKFADMVKQPAESIGYKAISALKDSLSGMSEVLSANIDLQPVIAPILDLSSVKKDASAIGSMFALSPIAVDTSYSNAQSASTGLSNNQAATASIDESTLGTSLTFVQNNTSPKALSPADIYRQTKNQLSMAKGALTAA